MKLNLVENAPQMGEHEYHELPYLAIQFLNTHPKKPLFLTFDEGEFAVNEIRIEDPKAEYKRAILEFSSEQAAKEALGYLYSKLPQFKDLIEPADRKVKQWASKIVINVKAGGNIIPKKSHFPLQVSQRTIVKPVVVFDAKNNETKPSFGTSSKFKEGKPVQAVESLYPPLHDLEHRKQKMLQARELLKHHSILPKTNSLSSVGDYSFNRRLTLKKPYDYMTFDTMEKARKALQILQAGLLRDVRIVSDVYIIVIFDEEQYKTESFVKPTVSKK